MPRRFSSLFRQHLDPFTRAWADLVYDDRRTDLATLLTFRELVEHVPDLLDELLAEAILVYASSLRPVVPTRGSVWPPPRRRRQP